MTSHQVKTLLLLCLALLLIRLPGASAQNGKGKEKEVSSGSHTAAAATLDNKAKRPLFEGVTRVSTDQAVRNATREASIKKGARDRESSREEAFTNSSVLEFQPAPGSAADSKGVASDSKESKKPVLKNVHGTAYGSVVPGRSGNHTAGASAGATSKGRKAYVYVETDHSRTTSPK